MKSQHTKQIGLPGWIGPIALAAVAVFLLAVSVYGEFRTLENPALLVEPGTAFSRDKTLSYPEFTRQHLRSDGETRAQYVARTMGLIHDTIAHYWHTDRARDQYFARIPVWENYWLTMLGLVGGERFARYEFFDWRRALERGIGLCSQHAMAAVSLLTDQGVPARMVKLNGHVVAEAEVEPGVWWTVDTDFGVLLPFDVDTAAADPDRVHSYYRHVAGLCRPDFDRCANADHLIASFGSTRDNQRTNVGTAAYSPIGFALEKATYWLKYPFPVFLIALALLWHRGGVRQLRPARSEP